MRQPNPTANRFKFKCDRIYIDVFINRCRSRAEIIQAGPIGPNKISSSNHHHHHHHQPPSSTTRNAIANAQHRACRRINLIQMLRGGLWGGGLGFFVTKCARVFRCNKIAVREYVCVCVCVWSADLYDRYRKSHPTKPSPVDAVAFRPPHAPIEP